MIFFYILFALYVAYVWIDYFRMLDIFKTSHIGLVISQFLLGAGMVFPVAAWTLWAPDFHLIHKGDDAISTILFNIVEVGMVEEFLKFLPFILSYAFIKKYLEEPIDYVMAICASALGFSALENILYFMDSNVITIAGRAMFSTVSHFFNSSLLAYAVIRWKFKKQGDGVIWFLFAFLLASLSHGLYNSMMGIENLRLMTSLIFNVFYFMIVVNWFASVVNSAINNSEFFSYKKYIDGNVLSKKLAIRYSIILGGAVLLSMISESFDRGLQVMLYSALGMAMVLSIVMFRITRLTLRKGHWSAVTLSFPVRIARFSMPGPMSARYVIIGSSIGENLLHRHFDQPSDITPISTRSTYLDYTRNSLMFDKVFINDVAFFVVNIYHDSREGKFDTVLIKDKSTGESWCGSAPIVGLYEIPEDRKNDLSKLKLDELSFIEWAWMSNEN